uniref:Uncharacterized protein n=1 Tax=Bubo bubo TaxID=30461 RepID=A0A8C0F796_BUBBB
ISLQFTSHPHLQVSNPQEAQTLFHCVPAPQSCCQAQPRTFPLSSSCFPPRPAPGSSATETSQEEKKSQNTINVN